MTFLDVSQWNTGAFLFWGLVPVNIYSQNIISRHNCRTNRKFWRNSDFTDMIKKEMTNLSNYIDTCVDQSSVVKLWSCKIQNGDKFAQRIAIIVLKITYKGILVRPLRDRKDFCGWLYLTKVWRLLRSNVTSFINAAISTTWWQSSKLTQNRRQLRQHQHTS